MSLTYDMRNEDLTVSEKGVKIEVRPERCTGCLICQLRCSFEYTPNIFNPSKARIVTYPTDGRKISFTEECNNCGLCARFCVYGALEIKGRA